MDIKAATQKLENEWDVDAGFFGRLRYGFFDEAGLQRVKDILRSVDTSYELLDKRFVSLTWFIPTFMSWQRERVIGRGRDVEILDRATHEMIELLYKVLGTP